MIGVACAIVTAVKTIKVSQDHSPVASEVLALTRTALDVLLGFEM
jgi:hypothetical protein